VCQSILPPKIEECTKSTVKAYEQRSVRQNAFKSFCLLISFLSLSLSLSNHTFSSHHKMSLLPQLFLYFYLHKKNNPDFFFHASLFLFYDIFFMTQEFFFSFPSPPSPACFVRVVSTIQLLTQRTPTKRPEGSLTHC
jgi:hypothetical protein